MMSIINKCCRTTLEALSNMRKKKKNQAQRVFNVSVGNFKNRHIVYNK